MHIHGATLNPVPQSAQISQSELAARQASETRKKLFSNASELDAGSSVTDPWAISMVGSFADSSQGNRSLAGSSTEAPSEGQNPQEEVRKSPAVGPVSYWA